MVVSHCLAYANGLGKQPHGHPARLDEDRAKFGDAYRGKAEAEMIRIVMKMLVSRTVGASQRGFETPS